MQATSAHLPRLVLAKWQSAMALMGLGLGTTTFGIAWDFYVHEIQHIAVESAYAAPHLLIFAGFGITALGFLAALVGVRLRPLAAR